MQWLHLTFKLFVWVRFHLGEAAPDTHESQEIAYKIYSNQMSCGSILIQLARTDANFPDSSLLSARRLHPFTCILMDLSLQNGDDKCPRHLAFVSNSRLRQIEPQSLNRCIGDIQHDWKSFSSFHCSLWLVSRVSSCTTTERCFHFGWCPVYHQVSFGRLWFRWLSEVSRASDFGAQ